MAGHEMPTECPMCGGTLLRLNPICDGSTGLVALRQRCNDCGSAWTERRRVVGVGEGWVELGPVVAEEVFMSFVQPRRLDIDWYRPSEAGERGSER